MMSGVWAWIISGLTDTSLQDWINDTKVSDLEFWGLSQIPLPYVCPAQRHTVSTELVCVG